jgi:hypothetical protein
VGEGVAGTGKLGSITEWKRGVAGMGKLGSITEWKRGVAGTGKLELIREWEGVVAGTCKPGSNALKAGDTCVVVRMDPLALSTLS